MRDLIAKIRRWMTKEPSTGASKTEEIDQAIQELRGLNNASKEVLDRVKQPDILRSLVIAMQAGKNQ